MEKIIIIIFLFLLCLYKISSSCISNTNYYSVVDTFVPISTYDCTDCAFGNTGAFRANTLVIGNGRLDTDEEALVFSSFSREPGTDNWRPEEDYNNEEGTYSIALALNYRSLMIIEYIVGYGTILEQYPADFTGAFNDDNHIDHPDCADGTYGGNPLPYHQNKGLAVSDTVLICKCTRRGTIDDLIWVVWVSPDAIVDWIPIGYIDIYNKEGTNLSSYYSSGFVRNDGELIVVGVPAVGTVDIYRVKDDLSGVELLSSTNIDGAPRLGTAVTCRPNWHDMKYPDDRDLCIFCDGVTTSTGTCYVFTDVLHTPLLQTSFQGGKPGTSKGFGRNGITFVETTSISRLVVANRGPPPQVDYFRGSETANLYMYDFVPPSTFNLINTITVSNTSPDGSEFVGVTLRGTLFGTSAYLYISVTTTDYNSIYQRGILACVDNYLSGCGSCGCDADFEDTHDICYDNQCIDDDNSIPGDPINYDPYDTAICRSSASCHHTSSFYMGPEFTWTGSCNASCGGVTTSGYCTNQGTCLPIASCSTTPTPTVSNSGTRTPSRSFTSTNTMSQTQTPSPTQTPSNTGTSTQTPTRTSTGTVTQTPTGTPTNSPSSSETPSISLSSSSTPSPSNTITPSISPTMSPTTTISESSTSTPTSSITPSPSETPTSSNSATPSQTPSTSPSSSITPSSSQSESFTPTPSISFSATTTISETSTSSPSQTETPSITSTPTQTVTPTLSYSSIPTPTSTETPTSTSSLTMTPTTTLSLSQTPSISMSQTSSISETPTVTPSMTGTPTGSMTMSPTATTTISTSPSSTPSTTISPSTTSTGSISSSPTISGSTTQSQSNSQTMTTSPTMSMSQTMTPSMTTTPSITPSTTSTPSPCPTPPECYVIESEFPGDCTTVPDTRGNNCSTPSFHCDGLGECSPYVCDEDDSCFGDIPCSEYRRELYLNTTRLLFSVDHCLNHNPINHNNEILNLDVVIQGYSGSKTVVEWINTAMIIFHRSSDYCMNLTSCYDFYTDREIHIEGQYILDRLLSLIEIHYFPNVKCHPDTIGIGEVSCAPSNGAWWGLMLFEDLLTVNDFIDSDFNDMIPKERICKIKDHDSNILALWAENILIAKGSYFSNHTLQITTNGSFVDVYPNIDYIDTTHPLFQNGSLYSVTRKYNVDRTPTIYGWNETNSNIVTLLDNSRSIIEPHPSSFLVNDRIINTNPLLPMYCSKYITHSISYPVVNAIDIIPIDQSQIYVVSSVNTYRTSVLALTEVVAENYTVVHNSVDFQGITHLNMTTGLFVDEPCFKWCKERESIFKCYPNFVNYNNFLLDSNNTICNNDISCYYWYQYPNSSYVYDNVHLIDKYGTCF